MSITFFVKNKKKPSGGRSARDERRGGTTAGAEFIAV